MLLRAGLRRPLVPVGVELVPELLACFSKVILYSACRCAAVWRESRFVRFAIEYC
jgi:hypothetical protein